MKVILKKYGEKDTSELEINDLTKLKAELGKRVLKQSALLTFIDNETVLVEYTGPQYKWTPDIASEY